jgi:PAS domain S-box-containing protein
MIEARAARLQALTAALSAAVDPETVAAAIIDQALPALRANAGNVYLLSDDARELVSIAAVGYDEAVLDRARRLPVDGPAMLAEVVRRGEAIILPTWEERLARYPHHRTVHAVGGDRAVVGLPLAAKGRTIGALSLAFPTDRDFDSGERRFMATVADLCAQALDRARLHRSLQESEARFRLLVDAMPQIAWVIDAVSGELEYLNDRWFDYTGAERGLLSTQLVNAFIHPDEQLAIEERWAEAFRVGEPFEAELRLRAADGSYRWFLTRAVPVPDERGRVVKWFGTSTDIDNSKRADRSQKFLADLGQLLGTSLDVTDTLRQVTRLAIPTLGDYSFVDLVLPDGGVHRVAWAHVESSQEHVLDAQLADFAPRQIHPIHPIARTLEIGASHLVPDVSDEWLQQIAFSPSHLAFLRSLHFRSQLTVPLTARGQTLGAITFCFTDRSGRRHTPDDLLLAREVAGRVAIAVDNARLYREARDAEAKVRRLLDAGVVGVFVADPERIIEANDRFLAIVRYPRAALDRGGLRWREMTPPEFAERDDCAIAELDARGVCTPFEKEYIRGDGSRIPVLLGAAELRRAPTQWIGFVLDLTDRKRAENEWRAFIDATAHDIRNPLTAILGQSELLLRRTRRVGAVSLEEVEQKGAAIVTAARRAAGLIDDLIDTAHLQAGQPLELRPAAVDLIALLATSAEEARRASPSHVIRNEHDGETLVAIVDGPRIERVVRNILDNAIKYSPDREEIVVRAHVERHEAGRWAVITISDRGIGIPAADLPRVFERFHRGSNVANRIQGSGIGLGGARQIVEQHGGTIDVQSEEGVGSTFTVRLPLAPGG